MTKPKKEDEKVEVETNPPQKKEDNVVPKTNTINTNTDAQNNPTNNNTSNSPKSSTRKQTKKNSKREEKKTLKELVEANNTRDVLVKLVDKGYYMQYIHEVELYKAGKEVPVTITESEFNKIIK